MSRSPDAVARRAPIEGRSTGSPVLGGAFVASQLLALNAVGLFATAFIIRRLGPLQYGQWATAAALASAHLLMTSAGLRTVFVRDLAQRWELAPELLATQLSLRIALAGVAAGSAIAVSVLLRYPPVVVACTAVGCVWIVISVIASTYGDVLQSLEQFGSYSATAFAAGVAVTASSVAAVCLGCGPIGLSIAYLTAPAVSALLCWRAVRKHVEVRLEWDAARAWARLREARLVGLNQLATAVRDRTEPLVVPRLVGLEAFGIFSAGAMIADRLANVPDAICTAFYPRISRAAQAAFGVPPEQTVARMLSVGLAASLPFAIVGMHLAESLSGILLPGAHEACRRVIQVSVWSVPLLAVSSGMTFALQATGRHDVVARSGLRATAVSAALSCASIGAAGIEGASWAVVARPLILIIGLSAPFRRAFPHALAKVPVWRISLAATALVGVCLAGERGRVWIALVYAAAGAVTYALALLASGVFSITTFLRLIAPAPGRPAVHLET
ncbi:MAG TPA: oligosaccharide flippase family protein [Vicinamibacterales bacterium]|nr:oligosaccharide flippase family protein [Vicinamibacterales bacterium]